MLLTTATWSKIRDQFTEEEKNQLHDAQCGHTICPPGGVLDEAKLSPELWRKLTDAKAAVR